LGAWHQLNLNLFKKALSVGSGKLTSELNGIVEEINKKEQSFEKLSDEEIKNIEKKFKNLYIIGNYHNGVSVSSCIDIAKIKSEKIIRNGKHN